MTQAGDRLIGAAKEMRASLEKGWWYRATQEQKLAQIDAAIELGMTAKQVAMNCGCYISDRHTSTIVDAFARYHGRRFAGETTARNHPKSAIVGRDLSGKPVRRYQRELSQAKEAFLSGEPVDFWSAK